MFTAFYFCDIDDSFVLPQMEILDQRREGKSCVLKVDAEIICDFEDSLRSNVT